MDSQVTNGVSRLKGSSYATWMKQASRTVVPAIDGHNLECLEVHNSEVLAMVMPGCVHKSPSLSMKQEDEA